jgi:hypothetical protein
MRNVIFNDLWSSAEKFGSLLVRATWGIALTLLVSFACTVVSIKATSRTDELTGIEEAGKS